MSATCTCHEVWGAVLDGHGVPAALDPDKKAAIVNALRELYSIGRAVKKRDAMGEVELLVADIYKESEAWLRADEIANGRI